MPLADRIPGACADTTRATSAVVGAPESSIDSCCSDSISLDRRASRLRLTRAPLLAEAEEAGDTRDDDGGREGDAPAGHLVVVAEGDLSSRLDDQPQRCAPAEHEREDGRPESPVPDGQRDGSDEQRVARLGPADLGLQDEERRDERDGDGDEAEQVARRARTSARVHSAARVCVSRGHVLHCVAVAQIQSLIRAIPSVARAITSDRREDDPEVDLVAEQAELEVHAHDSRRAACPAGSGPRRVSGPS